MLRLENRQRVIKTREHLFDPSPQFGCEKCEQFLKYLREFAFDFNAHTLLFLIEDLLEVFPP